jgi:hypothetical protein
MPALRQPSPTQSRSVFSQFCRRSCGCSAAPLCEPRHTATSCTSSNPAAKLGSRQIDESFATAIHPAAQARHPGQPAGELRLECWSVFSLHDGSTPGELVMAGDEVCRFRFAAYPAVLMPHHAQMRHAALPSLRHTELAKRVAPALLGKLRHCERTLHTASARRHVQTALSAQDRPRGSSLLLTVRASGCTQQQQPAATSQTVAERRFGRAGQSGLMTAGSDAAALSHGMRGCTVASAAAAPSGSGIVLHQCRACLRFGTHIGAGQMS